MSANLTDHLYEHWEGLGNRRAWVLYGLVVLLVMGILGVGIVQIRKTSQANFRLGLEALSKEDWATALRRFEAVEGRFLAPNGTSAIFFAARAREGLGLYDAAAQGYAAFLAKSPDDLLAPSAAMGIARVREAAGDSPGARAAADEAFRKYGTGSLGGTIRLEGARLALAAGDTPAAKELLAPLLARTGSDTDPAAVLAPWARGILTAEQ